MAEKFLQAPEGKLCLPFGAFGVNPQGYSGIRPEFILLKLMTLADSPVKLEPFGAAWSRTETWQPRGSLVPGLARAVWVGPAARSLSELPAIWPKEPGPRLSSRELSALLKALKTGVEALALRAALKLEPEETWPGWERLEALLAEPPAFAPGPAKGVLVASDWRSGVAGLWGPTIAALQAGRPAVLLCDEAFPEWWLVLRAAIERVLGSAAGLCPLVGNRDGTVQAVLATGQIGDVFAEGIEADRERWNQLVAKAPKAPLTRGTLPFGFGLERLGQELPKLHFRALTKDTLHKPLGAKVGTWIDTAWAKSFGSGASLGGFAEGAPGAWVVPATEFSAVTEALLESLERRREQAVFPILDPKFRDSMQSVRNLALGKGATLLHAFGGSTGAGSGAKMPCQIFTNVEPETAQQLGAWMTPTLALCRGEWTL